MSGRLSGASLRSPQAIGGFALSSILAGWVLWTAFVKYVKLSQTSVVAQPTALVRQTSAWVMERAQHVTISKPAIQKLAKGVSQSDMEAMRAPSAFDAASHFVDRSWRTAQYLLCVDALNFCFWPVQGLEYQHLSTGLKRLVEQEGDRVLRADYLARITGQELRRFFGWTSELPQEEERVRLTQEVGRVLLAHFGGRASNLILAAGGSAVQLVALLAAYFPGFRDHAVYRGRQVFFYKRAQIFAADIWGAYCGRGLGAFRDIGDLTMFADYRVPELLRRLGVLSYTAELDARVFVKQEIAAGSAEEVEIRAASVQAVELLRAALVAQHGDGAAPSALQLDWWLWARGERSRAQTPPHHRALTIFY